MYCKKFIFAQVLTAILTAIFVSCNTKNRGEWQLSDMRKDTLFIAETDGHTDDSIKVHGISIAGGDIKKELKVDWYNPKVAVRFQAYLAKKGSLKIKYSVPTNY
ncbi:hypothetical protein MUB18_15745 [Sphingobacterium sp. PCS056]|uniref:hypothetical protein n=1 Tax=Sphingobacterium sp. PCS056 TaxID=2931400 RepID=UPI00200BAB41|nr:hypothetical protein [Sphingobacterium sp. PCS056]UPZ35553.1 hypothetical protein MUB18_15745 [Sphingobacterium sp. PCS056]